MENYIDLKKLNLDELVGVINLYPWFSVARVELCNRMMHMENGWSTSQFAEAAMYVASRRKLAEMIRKPVVADWKDEGIKETLAEDISHVPERKVFVVGGDYFSQEAYDKVRRSDDHVFSRYAAKAKGERSHVGQIDSVDFDMYTETLAQIYADQGYFEQAKEIYSKLILAYPEKNTYFAALIQKIEEINS